MGPGKLVLTYDESSKTLTSPSGVSYSDFSTYNMSDIVATKQTASAGGDSDPIAGTWGVTCKYGFEGYYP